MNENFRNELREKGYYINIEPSVYLKPWELSIFPEEDGEDIGFDEYGRCNTSISLDIDILDLDGKFVETIGEARLEVINSHIFFEDTFDMIDAHTAEMESYLSALDYSDHEANYREKGFDYEYQPFVIFSRLFIKENYRGLGIGGLVIKNVNKLINSMLNVDTRLLVWMTGPLAEVGKPIKHPTDEDFKKLYAFADSVGAELILTDGPYKYYCYDSRM